MKKKTLRTSVSVLGSAVITMGLAACDEAPPPPSATVSPHPAATETESEAADTTAEIREAIEEVIRDKDPFARARRLGEMLPTLGPESIGAARAVLENPYLAFELGAGEVVLLLEYWGSYQPGEATRWAADDSPTAHRIPAVFATLRSWAAVDPEAARVASEEWRRRPDIADAAQVALVLGWFDRGDPPDLQDYIRGLGVSVVRQRAISAYVRAYLRKHGIDALMLWAESLPDDDERYKLGVYRQVAYRVTTHDVGAGIRWCEAHCEGPYGSELRNMVASAWAREDAPATLEWLATAPESRERNFNSRVVFAQWVQRDREAALEWMTARVVASELDPLQQAMLPVYARALAPDAPMEAIGWAERVEKDGEREVTLIEVARAWCRVDRPACEAWLLDSPLSEEARAKARVQRGAGAGPPAG